MKFQNYTAWPATGRRRPRSRKWNRKALPLTMRVSYVLTQQISPLNLISCSRVRPERDPRGFGGEGHTCTLRREPAAAD